MSNVTQKGLDIKAAFSNFYAELKSILDGKVDSVTGKGLSTEDYTTAEKTKVSEAVTSSDFTSIVKVTESNYPASPDPNVLYVVVAD